MNRYLVPILAPLAVSLLAAAPVYADNGIIVAAQETRVKVVPRAAQLRLINLPAIDFGLRASLRCSGNPVSLTLSISDTYTTLTAASLVGRRAVETNLVVPARQIALAASRQFCIADDDDSMSELLVPGLVTAHASLRCEKNGASTVHYASAPLLLRLTCERPPANAAQEAPAESSADDM